MKKIIALLLLLAMSFCLFACNSGGHEVTEEPPAPTVSLEKVRYGQIPAGGYDGSAVTITFYHTMNAGYQKVLDQYIAEFNKIYPNITVEHSQVGGYDEVRDTIKTELTTTNYPNIAYCYPDHVALYNDTLKVVPLDDFIESTIPDTLGGGVLGLTAAQVADFLPQYYEEGRVFDAAGTMYTLPLSKSTEVLYYNKTFFDQHGLEVPTTWDELEEVCKKIKEIDPNSTPLGYDSEANWFITMCEQLDSPYTTSDPGMYFVFNNPTNRNFVKRFRTWYQNGWVTTKELSCSYTSTLFTEQTLYMCIGSSGGASYQRPDPDYYDNVFEVGIAPIPQANPANPAAISIGPSLCIFDHENKQEVVASWLFVKYLTTNPEFQAEFAKTSGYMPVINSATETDIFKNWIAKADGGDYIQALATSVAMSQSNAFFVSPAFNGSSEARDQVALLLQACFVATDADVDAMILEKFRLAVENCIAKT